MHARGVGTSQVVVHAHGEVARGLAVLDVWVEGKMQLFLLRQGESDIAATLGAALLKRDPDLPRVEGGSSLEGSGA